VYGLKNRTLFCADAGKITIGSIPIPRTNLKTMQDIKFPYYSGYIRNPNALGYVSLNKFIEIHKNPSQKTLDIIEQIGIAREQNNDKLKSTLKERLNAFTPSVFINLGDARKYRNIQAFTGLMQIDLDKIPSEAEAIGLKEHIFHTHEEIVCAYVSPSRRGVKALMRIKAPSMIGGVYSRDYAINKFKAMHLAVQTEFAEYGYFDTATKNAILPLFLSYDKEILYRNLEDCNVWTREKHIDPDYQNLNDTEAFKYDISKNHSKATDIVIEAIKSITDNGHPQVRSASLILGSRVGAGYISRDEAYWLMENLIKSNSYLQKNINGYIKTSKWGIDNGMLNPKFY